MTPTINFPTALDTNDNLFLVHDSLRVKLYADYNVGDTSIQVYGDYNTLIKFPASGLITLTEQLSDVDLRAISFYYSSITIDTLTNTAIFAGLEKLPEFTDTFKPAEKTNVTQNVMSQHHNNLKDALIAIQTFAGTSNTVDTMPYGETLTGRIGYLEKQVFTPRAWFVADAVVGLYPLTVTFTEQCARLGDGEVTLTWNFGDGTTQTQTRTAENMTVEKTYTSPGVYDVTLTVTNDVGTDTLKFTGMIIAKDICPIEADISLTALASQNMAPGVLQGGVIPTPPPYVPLFDRLATEAAGPYSIVPTIRSQINSFIEIGIDNPHVENPATPGYSYAGEKLSSGTPIDPINTYTWYLGDDLTHANSNTTRASYSIGGVYDLTLRVDTTCGAYRITTYKNAIDIIENKNLWLFNINNSNVVIANEFGLISETFKTATRTHTITRNSSFLTGTNNESQAKAEFNRNVKFANVNTLPSGSKGKSLLTWSKGGDAWGLQYMDFLQYEGFTDVYNLPIDDSTGLPLSIRRPWNWILFHSDTNLYCILGPKQEIVPNSNYTNQTKNTINLSNYVISSSEMSISNYISGAEDLLENITEDYDSFGEPLNGRFSVYRSAWKDQTGYILRNSGIGNFFRIQSFFKTEGTLGEPFINISKMPDMIGTTKVEGDLAVLDNGIFFFNNSGNVTAWNTVTNKWESGNVSNFAALQVSTVINFDDRANTLLVTSDKDKNAYLSYDYSVSAFMKFNSTDMTFTRLTARPTGNQWTMGVY